MTTTIRLRGPADIISVLPYHLGYRPTDSLVLVCISGGQFGLVARSDLPPPTVDPCVMVDELLPVVRRDRPERVVIVSFESAAGASDAVSSVMRDALLDADIDVPARLVVRGDRWRDADCDWTCCPPEGEPLPGEDEVPAISQYIVMGRDPAPSRAALAARLDGRSNARPGLDALAQVDAAEDTRCAALMRHLEESKRSRRSLARFRRDAVRHWGRLLTGPAETSTADQAWGQVVPLRGGSAKERQGTAAAPRPTTPEKPSLESWSWAVVSLLDITIRDLVIAWLCPGTLELDAFAQGLLRQAEEHLPARDGGEGVGGNRDEVLAPLTRVARQAPPELAPGPLTVLAYVAWFHGDGALARIAVERALLLDPGYHLAVILEQMVDVAVRPGRTA